MMPAPCQPIGCDNGYHLPGCVFAEADAAGTCTHCGKAAEGAWLTEDLLAMLADGAYPPHVCGACWYSVSAAALDSRCDSPGACQHVVRALG